MDDRTEYESGRDDNARECVKRGHNNKWMYKL